VREIFLQLIWLLQKCLYTQPVINYMLKVTITHHFYCSYTPLSSLQEKKCKMLLCNESNCKGKFRQKLYNNNHMEVMLHYRQNRNLPLSIKRKEENQVHDTCIVHTATSEKTHLRMKRNQNQAHSLTYCQVMLG